MNKILLTTMIFAFLELCSIGYADDLQDLRIQMENQYKAMQEIQAKLIELESRQKVQDEQIKTIGTGGKEAFKIPDTLKWAEKIKIYGDFRFRAEWYQAEKNQLTQSDQSQGRIRFRLSVDMKITDEFDVRSRLATGSSDDPRTTNQTLGENWVKKDFWLDRAYMDWHPKSIEGLHILAGKMGMPFQIINDLVWDGDVNPEGAAVTYSWKPGENLETFLAGGGFWVQENASDTDIGMWGVQSATKYTFDKEHYLLGGLSYYDYTEIKGKNVITYGSSNARGGNTVQGVSPFQYKFDYNLLELFGEYGCTMFGLPSAIQAQYVNNLASGVSADTGWLAGVRLNKAKKAGTWQFTYDYREAQRDSVLGAFAETDFIDGGVGGRGHRFGYKYQFTDSISGGAYYFMSQRARSNSSTSGAGSNKADDDFRRLRAEMIISF
jgi:hypothetical protein